MGVTTLASMTFTALHRALGSRPGPLTNELLDAAVAAGVRETDDLDWKSRLPAAKELRTSDFPKDVAAMANGGGGLIVFGVREEQKAATERVGVEGFSETYERSLCSIAISAISPPVFGLKVHHLGAEGNRAVVVEVPASADTPHLIYRNEMFGAPVRNDSDTVWMQERQLEAMYRARFDERRHATESLDALFSEAAEGRPTHERAWFIGVARPRVQLLRDRLSLDGARKVLVETERLALTYADRSQSHPLEHMERRALRPGLRRWVAATSTSERQRWLEAWASVHHDGSVTLATAVGGRKHASGYLEGWQVDSAALELAVANLMALSRAAGGATSNDEYDVRIGVEWSGGEPLMIVTRDNFGDWFEDSSIPLHRYTPVKTAVSVGASDLDFHRRVHELAEDCVNQGGIARLRCIHPLQPEHGG